MTIMRIFFGNFAVSACKKKNIILRTKEGIIGIKEIQNKKGLSMADKLKSCKNCGRMFVAWCGRGWWHSYCCERCMLEYYREHPDAEQWEKKGFIAACVFCLLFLVLIIYLMFH